MSRIENHLDQQTHALLKAIKSHRSIKLTVYTDAYAVIKFAIEPIQQVVVQEIDRPQVLKKH